MVEEHVIQLSHGGALIAYDKQCPDYPGAGIQYRCPNGMEMDLVLVEGDGPQDEYDPDRVRIYVYADPHQDDYTHKFEVSRTALELYDNPDPLPETPEKLLDDIIQLARTTGFDEGYARPDECPPDDETNRRIANLKEELLSMIKK